VNSRAIATQPGNINIQTEVLTLDNNAQLTASTSGQGNAGNIFVSSADQVSLSNSSIATASSSNARGTGGNIAIQAGALDINGSNITARSLGRGNAGEITLDVDGQLRSTGSRITTSTSRQDTQGGTVNIQAEDVVLRDRAIISAQSQGRGTAGTLTLNVRDRLQLFDSDITTNAPNSSGGDIQINATRSRDGSVRLGTRGIVLLEGDSDITTNSQGDGGNITIGGVGIIAFDDSDIISRSSAERGGDITLSTLFSEPSPPGSDPNFDNNGQVDLNAEGALAAGQITTPDTSTIQNSLLDLPDTAVDVNQLLANSCIVQTQEGGTFLVTGTGGLPQRPGDGALTPYSTGEVRALPQETSQQGWQRGDAIVEPQGVYQLSDGRLIMSRECE
jgi:large exoprotein involved in heme utilization and adhesion